MPLIQSEANSHGNHSPEKQPRTCVLNLKRVGKKNLNNTRVSLHSNLNVQDIIKIHLSYQNQENHSLNGKKINQPADNSTKINRISGLSDKDFKAAITAVLPESVTHPLKTNEKVENLINKIGVI